MKKEDPLDKDLQALTEDQEKKQYEEKCEIMADFVFSNFFDDDFQYFLIDFAKHCSEEEGCEETLSAELKKLAHNLSVINALCLRNSLSHAEDKPQCKLRCGDEERK